MNFNIRKLKIQIASKEKELRRCPLKSRDRIRHELARLRVALLIAQENRIEMVQSRAERSEMGLRSTGQGGR